MCKSAQVVEITRCGELPHCACHQVDVVGEVLREAADSELLARLGGVPELVSPPAPRPTLLQINMRGRAGTRKT